MDSTIQPSVGPPDATQIRLSILRHGYPPVPLLDKAPTMRDWRTICLDADESKVARWASNFRNCQNTGIVCGEVSGVDIDILDNELSERVEARAIKMLGYTPLRRIGLAPKVLLAYRLAEPMPKTETPELFLDNGQKAQVEVLGAGQQFVAFGIHPNTKRPYTWTDKRPDEIPVNQLPLVTPEALRAFVAEAEAMIRAAGGRTEKERNPPPEPSEPVIGGDFAYTPPRAAKTGNGRNDFFRHVNTAALQNISAWVQKLFPRAKHQSGTHGWRISSRDLGRDLEEDLSIHPDGIQDFGLREPRTAIDLVIEYGGAPDARAAALTLCEMMGCNPESLGFEPRQRLSAAIQRALETEPEPEAEKPEAAQVAEETEEDAQERKRGDDMAEIRKEIYANIRQIVARFNRDHMVIFDSGTLVLRESLDPVLKRRRFDRIQLRDLNSLYMNELHPVSVSDQGICKQKSASEIWLRHPERRQYLHGTEFNPATLASTPGFLNLWKGFDRKAKQGDWSLLREHMLDVVCCGNQEHFEYLMRWIANVFQNPATQAKTTVVMRGGEGTGKGTVATTIKKIIGTHAIAVSNPRQLVGNFNEHLRDLIFLFADEAFFAGDRAHIGALNTLVTEDMLPIEGKHKDVKDVRNMLHIMMASNEDWVVPAALDARRYFILDVSDKRAGDRAYFAAIYDQLNNGGYEAMLHDMLQMDLSDFDIADAPKTNALNNQKKLSLGIADQWWKDCLHKGYVFESIIGLDDLFNGWADFVSTRLLFLSYAAFSKSRGDRRPMDSERLGEFITQFSVGKERRNKVVVGEQMTDVIADNPKGIRSTRREARLTIKPRAWGYLFGTLTEARKRFETVRKLPVEWDGCVDED